MSRAERRREMRGQEKKEVTRVMTIAQIQQMKKDMTELIADELLMKVVGIATLIIHDKFGMLMKKKKSMERAGKNGLLMNGKSSINFSRLEE